MKYTKSELRNTNMSLLRRIQRQVDKKENPVLLKPEKTNNMMFKSFALEPEEEIILTKKTRLSLYDKRKGR